MKTIISTVLIVLFFSSINYAQTFKVCKVKLAEKPLKERPAEKILKGLMNKDADNRFAQIENGQAGKPVLLSSSLEKEAQLIPSHTHSLIGAVYQSYAGHRPLVLSPDMIWLCIAQGFSLHVKENSEDLRHLFVDHEGQVNLDIERESYHPKERAFWEGIFPDFSKAIAKNTKKDVWKLVAPKFSTTTSVEKAAFEVTLMDAMSPYFTYSVSITCGIPSITLEGNYEDWLAIENRIKQLKEYGLDWWSDDLETMIKEFKLASQGKVNKRFWKDIFVVHQRNIMCGTEPYFQGWIFNLFPYFKKKSGKKVTYYQNPLVIGKKSKKKSVMDLEVLPSGMSRAKVLLNDNGAMTMLHFNAGFVGFSQNKETLALRPDIQWFIVDKKVKPSSKELAKYKKK